MLWTTPADIINHVALTRIKLQENVVRLEVPMRDAVST